ncbi:glutathione S-transferase [Achlya hypogyna]|uniref:Glutathione S-transferase n=1 Tax=Achlya hypogyna TaxID=1202772 RepID=A0A1V9YUD3_ACHHY|nr:glutathione S-transferase [Achlya hypogyna]
MAPNKLQLTYFAIPGRAELIRLVLAYGNVPFEDVRLTFPEYFSYKSSLDLPFGQVPTLRVNDKVTYAQSLAIARYAAKLSGLYPTDALLALEADSLVDAIVELVNVVVDAVFKTKDDALRATKFQTINTDILPRTLAQLEARVVGPYFTGAEVTFADVYLFDFFQNTLSNDQITVSGTDYAKLQAIVDRVQALPQLQAYLTKQ